jgi:hypothetical protein
VEVNVEHQALGREDPNDVAHALTAFITSIMARGRPIQPDDG